MRPRFVDLLAAGPLAGLVLGLITIALNAPESGFDVTRSLGLWIALASGTGLGVGLVLAAIARLAPVVVSRISPRPLGSLRRRVRDGMAAVVLTLAGLPATLELSRHVGRGSHDVRLLPLGIASIVVAVIIVIGNRAAFRRLTGISWSLVWLLAGTALFFVLRQTTVDTLPVLRRTGLVVVAAVGLLVTLRLFHARLPRRVRLGALGVALAMFLVAAFSERHDSTSADNATETLARWFGA